MVILWDKFEHDLFLRHHWNNGTWIGVNTTKWLIFLSARDVSGRFFEVGDLIYFSQNDGPLKSVCDYFSVWNCHERVYAPF